MKTRKIQTSDNLAVKQIIQKSLETFDLDIPGTAYFDTQLGELAEHFAATKRADYWVVEDDHGQVVACGGYGPFGEEETIGELQKLYVSAEAQGQGLSKILMDTIIKEAQKEYHYLYLETSTKLSVANKLYRNYGFESMSQPLTGSEHGAMDCWYIKQLNENKKEE